MPEFPFGAKYPWRQCTEAKNWQVSLVLCVCGMKQSETLLHMAEPMNEAMNRKWTWKHLKWCHTTWADNTMDFVQFCSLNPHTILLLSCLALVQWTGLARMKTKHNFPGSQVICSSQIFYLKTQSNTSPFQKGSQSILRQSPVKHQLHSDKRLKSQYMPVSNL